MSNSAHHLFRTSLYAAICISTIGLWLGEDNPLPYPWLVIFCAVAAYAFTDMWNMIAIPAALAPWLGAAAIVFFAREEYASYRIDPVLPLGHLITLFQLILLFHTKSSRTYWLLLLTSFLQMLIAALHNNRLAFGLLMGAFLPLIVWTMTQFLLLRESDRHAESTLHDPMRGRVRRSVASSLGSSLVIFLGAMVLFLVIPRRSQTAWTQAATRPGQYISGFDERIRLGQLGIILESDEEVMTIRLFDAAGQPYRAPDEPYWRGVALSEYERGGRWDRVLDLEPKPSPWSEETPDRFVRQEIRLQGVHRDVLFGLWPAFRGQTRSGEPIDKMFRDGTLVRPEATPIGALQYTVYSVPGARVRLRDEVIGRYMSERDARIRELKQLPDNLREPLKQYLAQHNISPDQPHIQICQAVLAHLQNPNEFDYTLRATVVNPAIDPVLDFLINRKEGHCEYFASAMALLLRAANVPSRVVNGFKGGDPNELFGPSIVVRQKHAHSWTEALVPMPNGEDYEWIQFDPTPGASRQRVVAMVSPTPSLVRQVGDLSRQLWSNYVLNFNSNEQEAAVYGPARRLIVQRGKQLLTSLRDLWTRETRGFNWRAAVAASLAMVVLIAALRIIFRLLTSGAFMWGDGNSARPRGALARFLEILRQLLDRLLPGKAGRHARVPFYDELLRQLSSHGISKHPTATARQFAHQAESALGVIPQFSPVARIPSELVDRYYRVRFGHQALEPSEAQEIDRMLNELGNALKR